MNYILIIGACILVICLLYYLITYNKLIRLNNNVKESFSTMDVYLKKRWDLIPNIVETVKGYAKHEKDTLKEIVNLRNSVDYDNLSDNDKIKKNTEISKNISKIMALAEAYPDLKANENFLSLSAELSSIEDEIAQSRKYYNAVVRDFNNKVEMIPSNIVAKMMNYTSKQMFIAEEKERASVKVEL
ncbi:MAG: LemA family protein [Candidatus Aphodocola sp.]